MDAAHDEYTTGDLRSAGVIVRTGQCGCATDCLNHASAAYQCGEYRAALQSIGATRERSIYNATATKN